MTQQGGEARRSRWARAAVVAAYVVVAALATYGVLWLGARFLVSRLDG